MVKTYSKTIHTIGLIILVWSTVRRWLPLKIMMSKDFGVLPPRIPFWNPFWNPLFGSLFWNSLSRDLNLELLFLDPHFESPECIVYSTDLIPSSREWSLEVLTWSCSYGNFVWPQWLLNNWWFCPMSDKSFRPESKCRVTRNKSLWEIYTYILQLFADFR